MFSILLYWTKRAWSLVVFQSPMVEGMILHASLMSSFHQGFNREYNYDETIEVLTAKVIMSVRMVVALLKFSWRLPVVKSVPSRLLALVRIVADVGARCDSE